MKENDCGVSLLHDTMSPEFGSTQKSAGVHETSLTFMLKYSKLVLIFAWHMIKCYSVFVIVGVP